MASDKVEKEPFSIGNCTIKRGERRTVDIEIPTLYTHTPMRMPVTVIRGRREGPVVFISAAVHGNELNGIEIIRRLKSSKSLKSLKGTLLLVPVVNVYGLINRSRYTPDRRDLNRSFPGSAKGSIAARLAQIFFEEIVVRSDFGIDLHTGAIHRSNLPQIRTNTADDFSLRLARAFGAPVILHSQLRDGSLRSYADEHGVPVLLYEAGEGLRFDERSIRAGVRGIVNVLREVQILPAVQRKKRCAESVVSESSSWIRAEYSGLIRIIKRLGDRVEGGEVIAYIDDPLGDGSFEIHSRYHGIVIGRSELPLVQEGDAIFNIAKFDDLDEVEETLGLWDEEENDIIDLKDEPPLL